MDYSNQKHALFCKELEKEILRLQKEIERRKKHGKAINSLFKQTVYPVAVMDRDYHYIRVNEAYAKLYSCKVLDFPGRNHFEFYPLANARKIFDQAVRIKKSLNVLSRPFNAPGYPERGVTYWDWEIIPLINAAGEVDSLVFTMIDVTGYVRTQESSKELFHKTFNASPLPMAIISKANGKYLEVNRAFLKWCGHTKDELLGTKDNSLHYWPKQITHSEFMKVIKKKGAIINLETCFRNKKGKMFNLLLSGEKIVWNNQECILAIANDVTELRRYQKEAARLERLHLVGQLAAGIGHEIRNPIHKISCFLQILKDKDRYARDQEYMDLMIDELDRVNEIITEFLSLAGNKVLTRKSHSLNRRIICLLPLLRADAKRNNKVINLELSNIPDLLVDKNEIHQLILNLVCNGLEAMEPGGKLTIKTYQDGGEVVLAVQDQGHGITPEALKNIGTPFFTTKENGTGLGLATCYSIADRHNAKIEIATNSNGTTFYVKFNVSSMGYNTTPAAFAIRSQNIARHMSN